MKTLIIIISALHTETVFKSLRPRKHLRCKLSYLLRILIVRTYYVAKHGLR